MKSSTQYIYLGMILAALFAVCLSRPGWRPQGRFGKRLSSSLPDSEAQHGLVLDVPIEFLFAKDELESAVSKPHLCSVTGLRNYPACSFQVSTNVADDRELLRSLLQRR